MDLCPFLNTLTPHCSGSDSEVAPPGFLTSHQIYRSFIFAQYAQGAFPKYHPWPWCCLCCKWVLSSAFHWCTDSISHPWTPSCSGSLAPSPSHLALPHSFPKAQPLAPAAPSFLSPAQAFPTTSSSNSSETTAEKIRLCRVLHCQAVEEKGFYVVAGISKGLMPAHTLVWWLSLHHPSYGQHWVPIYNLGHIPYHSYQTETNLHNCS